MERPTVDIYERVAAEYAARRQPRLRPEAQAFAARVLTGTLRADLGCGPGRYTADLGEPVVAFDAAGAMLALVPHRAPRALRIRGDLEALPFRHRGLAGAWANLSYQHLPRTRLPMALAQLHHALAVDAEVEMAVTEGEGEGDWPDDEFPGRFFARWSAHDLAGVLTGAGFAVEAITADTDTLRTRMVRQRTLPDVVGPGMKLLVCGLNPSLYAADAGVNFARPGNRFWSAALAAGVVSAAREPRAALVHDGVGLTDLVKRATARAEVLRAGEYRSGIERLAWLVGWLEPAAVCFIGLAGWRCAVDRRAVAGPQPQGFAGVPAYVMPSTSGLNARTSLTELTDHLRAAAALTGSSPNNAGN